MSTQSAQLPSIFNIPEKKTQSIDLKTITARYLYHWPLFIIGLILALTAVFIYLQTHKASYEIKAALIIKDEKKTSDQPSALHEIDLVNSSKIIENEIEVLKSKQLIGQVIQDLNLGIFYQKKDGLSYQDLYQSTPVKLTLLSATGNYEGAAINVVIKDSQSFFMIMPDGKQKACAFNTTFKNSFGSWKLEPTKNISQFKGATLNIALVDPEKLALVYQKTIDASLSNKLATTVVLSLNDNVAQRGKDFLNRLIYDYNLAGTLEKQRETKSTLDFIDQRLALLSGELTDAEKGIAGFKSSRGLTDITSDSQVSLQNMQANDSRLNEVNVQLSVVEGIERYVNAPQNSEKAPATLGIEDPALSNLIQKLSQLQLQREQLLATTPETNPDFEPINRQIATTKSAIKESVKNIKASLVGIQGKLQTFNSRFASSIKNIPTEERQYVSIKRQQAIKESLYNYLLQKREEVAVNYASAFANNRVVDQAYITSAKGPQSSLAYAVAFFLGLGLPAGLIYARNSFTNKITSIEEIKDAVNIPVIAELPFKISTDPAVNPDTVGEQFRLLRTKLYYLYGEKESGRVSLFTSSISGEGKSFVCSNLGIALANAGRKTLIIDMDLRKPQIAGLFNLPKESLGISNFLKGKATQADIIQSSNHIQNLYLITSGSAVQNPSELLEQKQLKVLILSLQAVYDDIIIDSPPVHLVPDALILSRFSDQTFYVIRQGFTEQQELTFVNELNEQKQLTSLNLIFNGIQRIKYGYGYKYDNEYYGQNKKAKGLSNVFSDFSKRF